MSTHDFRSLVQPSQPYVAPVSAYNPVKLVGISLASFLVVFAVIAACNYIGSDSLILGVLAATLIGVLVGGTLLVGKVNDVLRRGEPGRLILGILIFVVFGGFGLFRIGFYPSAIFYPAMHEIKDQVATDAVRQYQIADRQGDKIQICVQAGLVSAAYLQADDEAAFDHWKKIEHADCAAAGIPR
jgi:hypothetical protein